jgi:hypothetical protein
MRRFALFFCGLSLAAADSAPSPAEVDAILRELSSMTGFPVRKRVESAVVTKANVNEFLKQRIKEAVDPKELRAEELTLKAFGLVPADFDLGSSTVELLTEQAAAYYDFRRKKLFLTDWGSSSMGEAALVHELAHALADQSFGLGRFLKRAGNDEGASAVSAVMEGQATWLMTEYGLKKTGQSLATSGEMLRGGGQPGGGFPVFDNSPLYLRETLIFPYAEGVRFQHAVFEKMGKAAFREVFANPPVSTQQILHPEKYFARAVPAETPLPKHPLPRGYKTLVEGMVGELDHRILVEQYAGRAEAAAIAPQWRGGRFRLSEKGKQIVLSYSSAWEDAGAARRYFEAYRKVLQGKWKSMAIDSETPGAIRGRGDSGAFVTSIEGNVVTSVEGLEIN